MTMTGLESVNAHLILKRVCRGLPFPCMGDLPGGEVGDACPSS